MIRVILCALLGGIIPMFYVASAQAATYTSPSFSINGSIGDSISGPQSSTNYKMVATGGESIAGESSSKSYKIGSGYTASLAQALQLKVQPTGLSTYFPFSEGTGERSYDASASDNVATFNEATWGNGIIDKGLVSGAGKTGASVANNASISLSGTTVTASGWVKVSAAGTGVGEVIRKGTGSSVNYKVAIDYSTGKLLVGSAFNGVVQELNSNVDVVTDGAWHHFVYVADGTTMEVYVDGVLANSAAQQSGSLNANTSPLEFANSTGDLNGSIDEFKLYTRALNAAEVKAEYEANLAGNQAGLGLGTVVNGVPETAAADLIARTDTGGYALAVNQDKNLSLTGGTPSQTIAPVSGTIAAPITWNNGSTKGLGFTLFGTNATAIPGKWSSGGAYAALPTNPTSFYTRTNYTGGLVDVHKLRLKLDIVGSESAGNYTNTMTITGTTIP